MTVLSTQYNSSLCLIYTFGLIKINLVKQEVYDRPEIVHLSHMTKHDFFQISYRQFSFSKQYQTCRLKVKLKQKQDRCRQD